MANTASAKKRIRQNIKHRAINRWRLKSMRTAVKDLHEKILHASPEETDKALRETCSIIDRSAQRGVIHKNAAARTKSRLSARVKAKKAEA